MSSSCPPPKEVHSMAQKMRICCCMCVKDDKGKERVTGRGTKSVHCSSVFLPPPVPPSLVQVSRAMKMPGRRGEASVAWASMLRQAKVGMAGMCDVWQAKAGKQGRCEYTRQRQPCRYTEGQAKASMRQ